MRIFFAGIIQGSCRGREIKPQNYRDSIKKIIKEKYPDCEIVDPFESHSNSIDYDDDLARETFFKHLELIKSVDMMIVYLPEASMGTAIEMWQANHYHVPVISISPMATNWVIRLFAVKNFETIRAFEKFVTINNIEELIADYSPEKCKIEESS